MDAGTFEILEGQLDDALIKWMQAGTTMGNSNMQMAVKLQDLCESHGKTWYIDAGE